MNAIRRRPTGLDAGVPWAELIVGIGDVALLLGCFVTIVGGDLWHVVTWSGVLTACWLFFGLNQGAYSRSVLRQPLRSGYVASKATVIAGAIFFLVPLVGG